MLTVPLLNNNLPLWFSISIIIVYLGIIIILAEGLNRLSNSQAEVTRKVVHIGAGNVILLAWWLKIPSWIGVGASIGAAIIAIISYFTPILPSINSVGRKSLGTFFYALTIGITIAIFWGINHQEYAAISILVMAWGDGMAAIIGQRFGKHPYEFFGSQKSWEGSFAMLLTSFLVTYFILLGVRGNIWQNWLIAFIVALVATSLETFSKLGLDNLTVPLGSAAVGYILSQILL